MYTLNSLTKKTKKGRGCKDWHTLPRVRDIQNTIKSLNILYSFGRDVRQIHFIGDYLGWAKLVLISFALLSLSSSCTSLCMKVHFGSCQFKDFMFVTTDLGKFIRRVHIFYVFFHYNTFRTWLLSTRRVVANLVVAYDSSQFPKVVLVPAWELT